MMRLFIYTLLFSSLATFGCGDGKSKQSKSQKVYQEAGSGETPSNPSPAGPNPTPGGANPGPVAPTEPAPQSLDDSGLGATTFEASCKTCHASASDLVSVVPGETAATQVDTIKQSIKTAIDNPTAQGGVDQMNGLMLSEEQLQAISEYIVGSVTSGTPPPVTGSEPPAANPAEPATPEMPGTTPMVPPAAP